ncbi:MAG TPA: AAA family ATPase [Pirellulales bacterium]|nr:AAA family ATPase [Pirellulales bacterium]
MKLSRLDLKAFGPFTDEVLDLSAGECGLHLIYGPNEAGKSSALRALKQLLYGIPQRSGDDFVHPYANLRIGGLITNGNGSRLEILRRKGSKNDLRTADDTTIVEPGVLASYLGRLDRETFETMFGIDHAALVRGGQEIVEGKGNLGQVLFAAGSGIADLRGVQEELEREAAELFNPAPRAKNPRINARLAQWQAARKEVTAAQLPSAQWEQHDKALRQAQEQLAKADQELEQIRLEHARLSRIHQAIPLVVRLKATAVELAKLGAVRLLPDRFGERRRETAARLTIADTAVIAASQAIAELEEQIEKLAATESLLSRERGTGGTSPGSSAQPASALCFSIEAIDQLAKDLGSHRKAQHDLRGLLASREQVEVDARRMLKQLRPDIGLDAVETLRLSRRQQVEVQNLGNKYEALSTQCDQGRVNLTALSERLNQARNALSGLPAPRNPDLLKSVLRRAQSVIRVEEEQAEAATELTRLEEQAAAALRRLPLWTGTLEELELLAVPSAETIDTFEGRLAEAEQQCAALSDQIAGLEATLSQLDRKIEQILPDGDAPSEASLAEARRRRDDGWTLVRQAWLDGRPEPFEPNCLCEGETETSAGLADAFGESIQRADDIADRLRRDAEQLAARAALLAQRQACLDDLEKVASLGPKAEETRDAVTREWRTLWRRLDMEPQSPREMRAWERRYQQMLAQSEAIRRQRAAVVTFEARMANCRQELNRALAALDAPTTQQGETLAAQLERAQLLADEIDASAAARGRLTEEVAVLTRQLETERLKTTEAERGLAAWRARWSAAVAPLGLSPDATPAQVNETLAQLDALFAQVVEADRYRVRIEGIAAEAEQFCQRATAVVERLGQGELLTKLPVDQAADVLLARCRQAIEDRGRVQTLQRQREKHAAQLAEAKQTAAESRAMLDTLCRDAGCDDPAELPGLEERSALAKELQARQRNLHEQIALLSAGSPPDAFVEEVESTDCDGLPGKLDELDERASRLKAQRDELSKTVAVEANQLASADVRSAAAEAEEQAQGLAAEIAGDIETYVRLRLASAMLRAAIERYREKNQGPVLDRASRLFAELTVGSFAGLQADYNDQGDPVLVGIREGDGRPVTVDGMSEGTADQLYLALRLASLENYLDDHDPVPLVIDDILVNFDNERSLATLKVLAELSRRTQVIFFTHHEHLVEMAEEHLEPDVLYTHRLERASASRAKALVHCLR